MTATNAGLLDLPLEERAEMALKEAVSEVIQEHIRNGLPIYVWRHGKVVAVSPEKLRGCQKPDAK